MTNRETPESIFAAMLPLFKQAWESWQNRSLCIFAPLCGIM
jgi:hypothetical protein